MKHYTVNPTKKQLKIIKSCWLELQKEIDYFYYKVTQIENKMSEQTKIKDLEFFMGDNEYVGVGNSDRTMELIQRDVLEKLL